MSTSDSTVRWNGEEYDQEAFATAATIAVNSVAGNTHDIGGGTRDEYFSRLGRQYDGDRDIYDVLGYPDEIELPDYRAKYERQIGKRIVRLPAEDSWSKHPEIRDESGQEGDSEFETAVQKLAENVRLWNYARRVDAVAGIGHYGVLFIGFTDDADNNEEVDVNTLPDDAEDAISHFEPFAEDNVQDVTLGKEVGLDTTNERYNKPVEYDLDFGADTDPDTEEDDIDTVHWTRVLHVPSDGRDESDLVGEPRLKAVYNRLIDLEKTVGASAEIFWTGASPRYQFNVEAENASDVPEDELAKLDDEVQKLVHNMQNYIKTFNTDLEVISGEEVDPTGVHDAIMSDIAGTKGIPKRILMGSERGELASTQDRATWLSNVETRRIQYNEPTIVRALIDRFRSFDILPTPTDGTYDVHWPNLFELNEVEQSEVEANRAEVIANIAPKGNTDLLGSFDEIMSYVKTGEKPDFGGEPEPVLPEDNPEVQRQFGGDSDGSE